MGQSSNEIILAAHKGACAEYMENSLEAICTAYSYGATHVEVDIRKSKDDVLVLFHDFHTMKFNNKFQLVANLTAEELKRTNISGTGKVVTLKELLSYLSDCHIEGKLILDIKVSGIETEVLYLIDYFNFWDRVIISSFYFWILRSFKRKVSRNLRQAFIFPPFFIPTKLLVDLAKKTEVSYIDVSKWRVNVEFLENLGFNVYKPIQTVEEANKFFLNGGVGFTTDNMDLINYFSTKFSFC